MPSLLCYLILLVFLCGAAEAQDARNLRETLEKPRLSTDDWTALFAQAEDHPKQLLQDLANLWNQSSAATHGLLKARVGWMIGRFANYEEIPDFKVRKALRETLEIIEKQSLPIAAHDLRYFIAYTDPRSEDPKEQVEEMQKLITLADRIENKDTRAFAYTQLVFESLNSGISTARVPFLIDEVVKLLPMGESSASPLHLGTLGDLSAVLATIGQQSQAEVIYQRLDNACREQSLRVFCSIRAYNQGTLVLREEKSDKIQEAIRLFENSLRLSHDVGDGVMVAKNQYGLSRAYNQIERYEEAVRYGQEAADFLRQRLMDDWAALSLVQVARAYLGLKDPAKGLAFGLAALKLCPPNIESILTEIHLYLARSYEALGQSTEALQHYRKYMETERRIRMDDAHRRYMKLRDHSLSKENELQAHQITLLKRFRLVSILAAGLALILALAMFRSYRQSIVIRESRQSMKEVLDNIDEGIAILDRELKIKKGYSPFLHRLLGESRSRLEHVPFLDLLHGSEANWAHDKVVAKEALLACVGDSLLSWELNRDHLPHEMKLEDRILSLHWQPLLNSHQQIDSYLVAIRDLTAIKAMERQAQEQKRQVHDLQEKLEEILQGNLPNIKNLIHSIEESEQRFLKALQDNRERAPIERQLHTWKGLGRTLGLKGLAASIHDLEGELKQNLAPEELSMIWQKFLRTLADYQHILGSVLVTHGESGSRPSSLYDYGTLYASDFARRLLDQGCTVDGLNICDTVQDWDSEALSLLHPILLHVLTNAADHGFIRPKQRQLTLRAARIQILTRMKDEAVIIEVSDNGAGIDWELVKKKAKALGLERLDETDPGQLLFLDGLSTAEVASETSGRGIGLSAVKELCQKLSGDIKVCDNPGGGTKITISLPSSRLLKTESRLTA